MRNSSWVWKAIATSGEHAKYDWIVKAEADAVFLSRKLVERVYFMPVEDVRYGFSGNLEVISKTPFSILLAKIVSLEGWIEKWQVWPHERGHVRRNVHEEGWCK